MRLAVAITLMALIAFIGTGMLRSLWHAPRSVPLPEALPTPVNTRILFWCSTCGTEVLLLRRGSDAPPRHCGEGMDRREEVPREV